MDLNNVTQHNRRYAEVQHFLLIVPVTGEISSREFVIIIKSDAKSH